MILHDVAQVSAAFTFEPSVSLGARCKQRLLLVAASLALAGPAASLQTTTAERYPIAVCADTLRDELGGVCLRASSTPVLGQLYPLSQDLFVDASGRVGLGTIAPDADLTVIGDGRFRGDLRFDRDRDGILFGNESAFPQLPVPMITMFPDGVSNLARMVLGHSPAFESWGLEYRDVGDLFVFRGGSTEGLAVELGTGRVAIGHSAPAADLHLARTGSVSVLIEADTDDFDESHQPYLGFRQDGGTIETRLGFFDSADAFTVRSLANKDVIFDHGPAAASGTTTTAAWLFKNLTFNLLSGNYVQNVRFRLTALGDLHMDGSVFTPASDLAELYPAAPGVEPGDVVAFGGAALVLVPARAGGPLPAGIVSSRPGVLLGLSATDRECEPPTAAEVGAPEGVHPFVWSELRQSARAPLALAGRVPCKVSAENGPVRAGDLLTVAATPGHAARAGSRGAVVGTALEPLEQGRGTILVFVRTGWVGAAEPDGGARTLEELGALRRELERLRSELDELRGVAGR